MRETEFSSLLDLVASNGEKTVLSCRWSGYQKEIFYQIWTGKEAFLKAKGVGLIDDLPSVCIQELASQSGISFYATSLLSMFYLSAVVVGPGVKGLKPKLAQLAAAELLRALEQRAGW